MGVQVGPEYAARIRNLVSQYRRLETLRTSLSDEADNINQTIATLSQTLDERLALLNGLLAQLSPEPQRVIRADTNLAALRVELKQTREEDRDLTELSRTRSELRGLSERWRSLPDEDTSHDIAGKERRLRAAVDELNAWRSGSGKELEEALDSVRASFPDVPPLDDGPENSRITGERRAEAEAKRCAALVESSSVAAERLTSLKATIQRASTRIDELNKGMAGGVEDAKSITIALAGLAPHVEGEVCPVCSRDFTELDGGPLAAHIAAKIASLTNEAGRLQSLAKERAEESNRLALAQRDLLDAGSDLLPADELADLMVRAAQMTNSAQKLKFLANVAEAGERLMAEAAASRNALMLARRREELSMSLLPEIEANVERLIARSASSFATIDEALEEVDRNLVDRIEKANSILNLRIKVLSELELYMEDLNQLTTLTTKGNRVANRQKEVEQAIKLVNQRRNQAKEIAGAADEVRSSIVKKVFNTSLNKIWRDLFVRLAPSEPFVPAFKLPTGGRGMVEAVLETLHRSGKSSGSPSAMLSQGNLNTAALTLFLALHLSVPKRMPWLVLDDPVQSMDDVHIAQFAALLRTLSKGSDRQLIVAVHERALFDYLTLELSPAFPGDSLISVEITRNFAGETVAMPKVFGFEDDRAIAV